MIQQVQGGHFHPGGAETALDGPDLDKGLLNGMEPFARRGQTLHGPDGFAVHRHRQGQAGIDADRPSTRTVQAPQSPVPQPSLVPVRLRSSRSTSFKVRQGSTDRETSSPFTIKVNLMFHRTPSDLVRLYSPVCNLRG